MEAIEWEAPEFEYQEKDIKWYRWSMAIALTILVFALLTGNFIFAVFIILAEIMIIVWANQKPRILEFKLDNTGLEIEGYKKFDLRNFINFSILEYNEGNFNDLFLIFKDNLKTPLVVKISKGKTEDIRRFLSSIPLEETDPPQSFFITIQRFLRF